MTAPLQSIRFTTAADGVRLAYAITGKGPPLVRVPTWLSHLEHDWHSPLLRHWLVALGQGHTLIRYDGRGCGLSDWNATDLSFEAMVRDLEAVVDAAGAERVVMCGNSSAPGLAIAYAARHPERVSRMVLCGAFCRGLFKRPSADIARERLLLELIERAWGIENAEFRQVFAAMFAPDASMEQWRWLTEKMRFSTSPRNAARIWHESSFWDVRELASRVRCPTLVLHARRDALIPYEEGQLTAALIPGAEFVTLDSANHIIQEHEPAWQHVRAELHRFLGGTQECAGSAVAFKGLSAREREVLELIARGLGNDEIAGRLHISPRTVRNHITSVFSKLAVTSRAQAIVSARDAGYGRANGH